MTKWQTNMQMLSKVLPDLGFNYYAMVERKWAVIYSAKKRSQQCSEWRDVDSK